MGWLSDYSAREIEHDESGGIGLGDLTIDDLIEAQQQKDRINLSFYQPHPKHLQFHELGALSRDRLFLAANRIGKTLACSLEVIMHLTGNYPFWWKGYRYERPINVWVGGITEKEIDVLQRRYFDGDIGDLPWVHPSLVVYKNRTKHQYRIINKFGGTSLITFKTYQQGRETWQGEKLDLCHLDEEPPLNIYTEASMRLMSTSDDHRGMMLISATCLYFSPFVQTFTEEVVEVETLQDGEIIKEKKHLQRKEGEVKNDRVFIMAGWEDAPHISEEERKAFQSKIPPHELEARSRGVPSVGSGMVYPIQESLITCEPLEIPDYWPRVFGLDFGWKDPTAALFAAHDRDNDILYFYAEYAASELTPQHHARELIKQGANWMFGVYDPSGRITNLKDGSRLVDLYREAGIKQLSPANNSREAGVQTVLQRMQRGKLKIVKTLNKTLTEYRMYARNEDGLLKDGNDHLMDCMRYIVMSGLPLAKTRHLSQHESKNTFHSQLFKGQSGARWMGRV